MVGFIVTNRDLLTLLQDMDARYTAAIDGLGKGLAHINRRIYVMAVDTSKLVAVVQQIKDDATKNAADIQAIADKLAGITSTDPAVQTAIDQAVADLGGVRDTIEATNAKAEAAVA